LEFRKFEGAKPLQKSSPLSIKERGLKGVR